MRWSGDGVRVRVPATSANLGPGFDALGLALTLYDEVQARVTNGGLVIEIAGEGAALASAGENHLVVRAMRAAFDELGEQPPGLALRCVNNIPHGRGLGSSAAAIVAGILAARALAGHTRKDAALPLATSLEGHPDNVAAALFGGLTIAWIGGGARAVRLQPLETIRPVPIIAPAPVRTDIARGLLPDQVPHEDASFNSGRSALLVAALTTHPDELLDATADRLHQDYRAKAMPATWDLVTRLRAEGIPAVVSGAGPSVLAFTDRQTSLDQLTAIVDSNGAETGTAWSISPRDVSRHGTSIMSAPPIGGSRRDAGPSSSGHLNSAVRHGCQRRNAVGSVGVRLDAASSAPIWGRCWCAAPLLGGNVYQPRQWLLGITHRRLSASGHSTRYSGRWGSGHQTCERRGLKATRVTPTWRSVVGRGGVSRGWQVVKIMRISRGTPNRSGSHGTAAPVRRPHPGGRGS